MSDKVRCTCRRCAIRGLMGPAVITTIGILFLLGEFRGGYLAFHHTFPVILIVIGGILLAASMAPRALSRASTSPARSVSCMAN